MSTTKKDFNELANAILKLFEQYPSESSTDNFIADLRKIVPDADAAAGIDKSVVEYAFRIRLDHIIEENGQKTDFVPHFKLMDLSILVTESDLAEKHLPLQLFSDLCDACTIDTCEIIFNYLETKFDLITKNAQGNTASKLTIIGTCSKLLKRLSKTNNTLFCGRVLMLLAYAFPLLDPSGLNLGNEFNKSNVTTFDEDDGIMRHDLKDDMSIDYNFYKQFWTLQKYCNDPYQVFAANELQKEENWRQFISILSVILTTFTSYTFQDASEYEMLMKNTSSIKEAAKSKHATPANKPTPMDVDDYEEANSDNNHRYATDNSEFFYVPKYLTSKRLMNLQLRDSIFRRNILTQVLILIQVFETGPSKSFEASRLLTQRQLSQLEPLKKKVKELLEKEPQDGIPFTTAIMHILERENNWSNWKKVRCDPKHFVPVHPTPEGTGIHVKKLIPPYQATIRPSKKRDNMGNSELSMLWASTEEVDDLLKSKKTLRVQKFEEFISEFQAQLDPAAGIEDEYKLSNNPIYVWKAMRLASRNRLDVLAKLNSTPAPKKGDKQEAEHEQAQAQKTRLPTFEEVIRELAQEEPKRSSETEDVTESSSTKTTTRDTEAMDTESATASGTAAADEAVNAATPTPMETEETAKLPKSDKERSKMTKEEEQHLAAEQMPAPPAPADFTAKKEESVPKLTTDEGEKATEPAAEPKKEESDKQLTAEDKTDKDGRRSKRARKDEEPSVRVDDKPDSTAVAAPAESLSSDQAASEKKESTPVTREKKSSPTTTTTTITTESKPTSDAEPSTTSKHSPRSSSDSSTNESSESDKPTGEPSSTPSSSSSEKSSSSKESSSSSSLSKKRSHDEIAADTSPTKAATPAEQQPTTTDRQQQQPTEKTSASSTAKEAETTATSNKDETAAASEGDKNSPTTTPSAAAASSSSSSGSGITQTRVRQRVRRARKIGE